MILGIGTDLVHKDRIEAIYNKYDKRFTDKVGVGQYQRVCILSVEIIEITQMIVELGDILVKRLFGEERNIYGCPGNQVNGHLQIGLEK